MVLSNLLNCFGRALKLKEVKIDLAVVFFIKKFESMFLPLNTSRTPWPKVVSLKLI